MVYRGAPTPSNETDRLAALQQAALLDTLPEIAYDDIVALATAICRAPIGLIALIDANRQWFKACVGLDAKETDRDAAFCAHAILHPDELLVIEDTALDPRFSGDPLVLGPPYIRFYAGSPIVTEEGFALGTVSTLTCQSFS